MDENKLKEIEKELLNGIDNNIKTEKDINELSKQIAQSLYVNRKVKIEFQNIEYSFGYKLANKTVYITAANMDKFKILQEKYIPYRATAELLPQVTEYETIRGVVEALLKRFAGIIEPEELNN